MKPLKHGRSIVATGLAMVLLIAVYRAGVELGKRRAHRTLVDSISQTFRSAEASPARVIWSSSPSPLDPFDPDPFAIPDDPFSSESVADPFANE